jgi:hypothetical protein
MEDLTMELTVMNKRRYDELIGKITNLETEIAIAHTQLKAIESNNNQLAEIAFDESRFTQQLLDKVDDVAREAAKDAIEEAVTDLKETIMLEILQLIANKLTGKDKQEEVFMPITNGANHQQHIV